MNTVLYLIRHGNIDYAERVPGRMGEIHLSAQGMEQARWIARFLQDCSLTAVYSSPLERAIETAQPLAESHGLTVSIMDLLCEIDFGEWTGMHFSELENDFRWKQFHFFRNGCMIPGGELMVNVQKRMSEAMEKISHEHENKKVAVISHNDPIKSFLAGTLGISLDLFQRVGISTGSVSEIWFDGGLFHIRNVNITGAIV